MGEEVSIWGLVLAGSIYLVSLGGYIEKVKEGLPASGEEIPLLTTVTRHSLLVLLSLIFRISFQELIAESGISRKVGGVTKRTLNLEQQMTFHCLKPHSLQLTLYSTCYSLFCE